MALVATEWSTEVGLMVGLLASGWTIRLRDWAADLVANPWLVVALYCLPVGLLFALVSMVFGAVRVFILDRRFGLSTQSPGAWLWDETKMLGVGGAIVLLVIEILYALLRAFPSTWWIWAGATFGLLLLFIAHLAPVLLFPLFFRFTRLDDPEITRRIDNLAERSSVPVARVYEVDLSRRSRTANAALVGFGRTRRILLADNLLDNFTLDEIEAILAHEFAHHVGRHLAKATALQTLAFFAICFAIDLALKATPGRWGLDGLADVANLPVIGLTVSMAGLLILPLTNACLRRFEREADDYALRTSTVPRAFCSALRRLAQINLEDRSPHPFIEKVFYSHPSIDSRLRHAETVLASLGTEGESCK